MNIVIVGGGTAGLISALFFHKNFPSDSVKLIRSKEIGILGPGEGTTPLFNQFLKDLDIPIDEFIEKTGSTVKTGIKFTNWGTKKSHYFHGFDLRSFWRNKPLNKIIKHAVLTDTNLDKISITANSAYKGKVPIDTDAQRAWHFDAKLLAEFFENQAEKRGIELVDAIISDYSVNEKNNISSLILNNGMIIDADFIVDCTGFKRMFIGNYYKSEWNSVSDILPVNTAIPFFLKEEDPVPYTEAIAMDFGWAWKIPLQHRWGCGYVFDSKYISVDTAKQEIINKFGNNLEFGKVFTFNAGYFEKTLVNNVLAIGISSGFFEPLEATSIWVSLLGLEKFILLKNKFNFQLNNINEYIAQEYNYYIRDTYKKMMYLLYFHYYTNKTNTRFWIDIKNNINNSIELKERFDDLKDVVYNNKDIYPKFNYESWITIYIGNELYSKSIEFDKYSEMEYTKVVEEISHKSTDYLSLENWLESIKNNTIGEKNERN
jgi:tryptophan halogenase